MAAGLIRPHSPFIVPQKYFDLFPLEEIILPEKAVDEEGSKGYVRFTIYPKEDLQIEEEIRNTAGIYFDLNDPVITNTAISRLVKPTDK